MSQRKVGQHSRRGEPAAPERAQLDGRRTDSCGGPRWRGGSAPRLEEVQQLPAARHRRRLSCVGQAAARGGRRAFRQVWWRKQAASPPAPAPAPAARDGHRAGEGRQGCWPVTQVGEQPVAHREQVVLPEPHAAGAAAGAGAAVTAVVTAGTAAAAAAAAPRLVLCGFAVEATIDGADHVLEEARVQGLGEAVT